MRAYARLHQAYQGCVRCDENIARAEDLAAAEVWLRFAYSEDGAPPVGGAVQVGSGRP
jgi:hypothetical protein